MVLHRPFDAHLDHFLPAGADTINFALEGWDEPACDFGRVRDPESIARAAERDPREARALLLATVAAAANGAKDWPDELAAALREHTGLRLAEWAEARRLAPATVSRGFRQVYGLSPKAFRAQLRARRAWRAILRTGQPLASIAAETGFADQAHMTRAVRALTGHTPAQWRA